MKQVENSLYSFGYRWVSNAMNNPTDDKAQKAVDKISELGRLEEVYRKDVCYYDDWGVPVWNNQRYTQNAL